MCPTRMWSQRLLEYAFDTITAEQALAIKAGDTLAFNGGPGRTVSVSYQSYDPLALTPEVPRIFVTYEGRTLADIGLPNFARGAVRRDRLWQTGSGERGSRRV